MPAWKQTVESGSVLEQALCSVCGLGFRVGGEVATCSVDGAAHHLDCWAWNGAACGTPGCAGAGAIVPLPPPPPAAEVGAGARLQRAAPARPPAAGGAEACAACGRAVPAGWRFCPACGAALAKADPAALPPAGDDEAVPGDHTLAVPPKMPAPPVPAPPPAPPPAPVHSMAATQVPALPTAANFPGAPLWVVAGGIGLLILGLLALLMSNVQAGASTIATTTAQAVRAETVVAMTTTTAEQEATTTALAIAQLQATAETAGTALAAYQEAATVTLMVEAQATAEVQQAETAAEAWSIQRTATSVAQQTVGLLTAATLTAIEGRNAIATSVAATNTAVSIQASAATVAAANTATAVWAAANATQTAKARATKPPATATDTPTHVWETAVAARVPSPPPLDIVEQPPSPAPDYAFYTVQYGDSFSTIYTKFCYPSWEFLCEQLTSDGQITNCTALYAGQTLKIRNLCLLTPTPLP